MKRGLIVLCCSALLACASPDVALYRDQKPVLDPVHYFSGKTEAWGMFQKRGGEVVKRFHVEIAGRVEGKALILDEHFSYSDGTTQQRTWTLLKQADGRWHGTAGDVVGRPSVKWPAMRCTGSTRCVCRWMAANTTCTWMTGCTRWTTTR